LAGGRRPDKIKPPEIKLHNIRLDERKRVAGLLLDIDANDLIAGTAEPHSGAAGTTEQV